VPVRRGFEQQLRRDRRSRHTKRSQSRVAEPSAYPGATWPRLALEIMREAAPPSF
jgi:hypothetical protein